MKSQKCYNKIVKAIILAAGIGSRISHRIDKAHKCLLPIPYREAEIPLIVYTIQTLKKNNVHDISVVTGYRHTEIEQAIQSYQVNIKYNPFYELMNSIGSLWFCADKLISNDDVLIFNADTFLDEEFYSSIINRPIDSQSPLLLIDSSRKDVADVKVTYTNNTLTLYGKEIPEPCMAESVDIAIIPQANTSKFHAQLLAMMEHKKFDTWWESVLVDYIHITPIEVQDIAGVFWSEIDFYEDYEKICSYLQKN